MTPAESVRAVLVRNTCIAEDESWAFACDELARIARRGDPSEVAQWLDALRIAVEDDPETRRVAAEIVDAARKENP